MTRKLFWLSLPVLFGLVLAALAVAAPAQTAKAQQETQQGVVQADDYPPGSDVYGVVDSFPQHLVGSWTVDNVVYTATNTTRFRMYAGPFYVGACVHVHFDPNGNVASLIETVFKYKCSESASQYLIGLIDQAPAVSSTISGTSSPTETWVISGVQIVSNRYTELNTEHGPLTVGNCASAEYRNVNGVNLASEISSEWMYRCLGPVAFNQAFGYVVTFPPDLNGSWVISNTMGMSLTFMTTPTSTLVVKNAHPLVTGACVNVKYYTSQGVNYGVRVVPIDQHACQGHLTYFQLPSKLYATIDTMPSPSGTMTGTWTMAGVNLTSTQSTRFDQEEGALAVGNCAEGTYTPNNGAMNLLKLESQEMEDCQAEESGAQRFTLYGMVEMMPTNGYSGTWQVSGVTFQATPTTTVGMDHGELAIGAYVKVYFTYDASSGVRTAQAIITHVAPGFGWISFHGHWGGWIHSPSGDKVIVDGKSFETDPDISAPTNLQSGSLVYVNAYQDSNGTMYVTQVSSGGQIFLPLMQSQR